MLFRVVPEELQLPAVNCTAFDSRSSFLFFFWQEEQFQFSRERMPHPGWFTPLRECALCFWLRYVSCVDHRSSSRARRFRSFNVHFLIWKKKRFWKDSPDISLSSSFSPPPPSSISPCCLSSLIFPPPLLPRVISPFACPPQRAMMQQRWTSAERRRTTHQTCRHLFYSLSSSVFLPKWCPPLPRTHPRMPGSPCELHIRITWRKTLLLPSLFSSSVLSLPLIPLSQDWSQ